MITRGHTFLFFRRVLGHLYTMAVLKCALQNVARQMHHIAQSAFKSPKSVSQCRYSATKADLSSGAFVVAVSPLVRSPISLSLRNLPTRCWSPVAETGFCGRCFAPAI
jgi:hypothetical protein